MVSITFIRRNHILIECMICSELKDKEKMCDQNSGFYKGLCKKCRNNSKIFNKLIKSYYNSYIMYEFADYNYTYESLSNKVINIIKIERKYLP